jgi:hypothetical protein
LFFEVPLEYSHALTLQDTSLKIALLLKAMNKNQAVTFEDTVDYQLARNITEFTRAFADYFPNIFHNIPFEFVNKTDLVAHKKNRVGIFFSGGVDSLYVLWDFLEKDVYYDKRKTEVYLIPILGMDLYNTATVKNVMAAAESIASQYDLKVLPVRSNVKDIVCNEHIIWQPHAHAVAKAAVAFALKDHFDLIALGSSVAYRDLSLDGSTACTDELWRTQDFRLVHVGANKSRLDKIADMANWDILESHVRVCFDENSVLNCGKCPKCLRTIFCIDAVGFTERFKHRFVPASFDNLDRKVWGLVSANPVLVKRIAEISNTYKARGNLEMPAALKKVYSYCSPSIEKQFLRKVKKKITDLFGISD